MGRFSNADQVAKELGALGTKTALRAAEVTRHFGQLLTTRVKAKASGRPGPNAPTGDYRRSITFVGGTFGPFVYALVGTNKVQGRRLEFGFVGTDSIGRRYNQGPLPHFGPAVEEMRPLYEQAIAAVLT